MSESFTLLLSIEILAEPVGLYGKSREQSSLMSEFLGPASATRHYTATLLQSTRLFCIAIRPQMPIEMAHDTWDIHLVSKS